MVTRITYRNQSKTFLEQAYSELRDGDLRQASEKGWGAAAQIVKAAAEVRGWEHNQHRLILVAASQLQEETGDMEIERLFWAAGALHTNFYEGNMGESAVTDALSQVARLVEKLASGRHCCRGSEGRGDPPSRTPAKVHQGVTHAA